ncbi:unnamed protein product [Lactuca virosa]|uniref:Uncharacterized protein n=1 Tax=Lactuca virosa TaxID=75947 RepID=A0AAU9MHF3_9ASTR|nr:unnamed protein product [Lactuca virosa]
MNIKDLNNHTKDFLSYLECGSLYIYLEFSSLLEYKLFIKVVIEEIGWLDFYSPLRLKFHHDGRRSKQQRINELFGESSSESTPSIPSNKGTIKSSALLEAQQNPVDMIDEKEK